MIYQVKHYMYRKPTIVQKIEVILHTQQNQTVLSRDPLKMMRAV